MKRHYAFVTGLFGVCHEGCGTPSETTAVVYSSLTELEWTLCSSQGLKRGNRYAVVSMDYLTKWPEVFVTADQTAPTIARLFVEEIVSCHGIPYQLLSDRGPLFLSKLFLECALY